MKKRTTDRIGIILSSAGMLGVLSLILVIPHNVEAATTATPTTQSLKMVQFYRTAQLQPQSGTTSGGCSFGTCQSGGSGTQVDGGTATFSILSPENRAGNPPVLVDLTADLGAASSTTATLKISGGTLKPLIGVMQTTDMTSTPTGTSFQVKANVGIFDPAISGSVSFSPTQEAQVVWLWTPPAEKGATIAVSLTGSGGTVTSSPIYVPASYPLPSGTTLNVSPNLNTTMTPGLSLFDPGATSMAAAETAEQHYGITGTIVFAGSEGAHISPTGSQALTLNGQTTTWTDPSIGQSVNMDATVSDNGSTPIRHTPFYAFSVKGSVAPTLNPAMTVTQKITPSPVVTPSPSPTPAPTTPSCPAPKTITKIEKVPGPTVTKTVDVPVIHTVTVTKTVDVPGPVVTKTVDVPVTHTVTVTKTVPGPTHTVTITKKVPGPTATINHTRTVIQKILHIPWAWLVTLNAAFVAVVTWWARRVHRTRQQSQSGGSEQE